MKRGKRELSNEERRLWIRITAGVRPRAATADEDRRAGAGAPPQKLRTPVAATQSVTPKTSKPEPVDRGAEKRVRRGKLDIGAALDLHGHTQATGRTALERFLRAAQGRGAQVVLVVTGAGRSGEGVLKRRLPEWLAEPALRSMASGYAKAHRIHGGEGAFYVFLRRVR